MIYVKTIKKRPLCLIIYNLTYLLPLKRAFQE